jgi:four helix bundle protein
VREADGALTDSDFAYKMSIARKEANETEYWIELAIRAELLSVEQAGPLRSEASELSRILSTIVRKTQAHVLQDKARQRT